MFYSVYSSEIRHVKSHENLKDIMGELLIDLSNVEKLYHEGKKQNWTDIPYMGYRKVSDEMREWFSSIDSTVIEYDGICFSSGNVDERGLLFESSEAALYYKMRWL